MVFEGAERAYAREARSLGIFAYAPRILVGTRGARAEEQLFPEYLFVWNLTDPLTLSRVQEIPGYVKFLTGAHRGHPRPVRVDHQAIQQIADLENEFGYVTFGSRRKFAAGSPVRLGATGPMGLFHKYPDTRDGRVSVLFELLGRTVEMRVDEVDLVEQTASAA